MGTSITIAFNAVLFVHMASRTALPHRRRDAAIIFLCLPAAKTREAGNRQHGMCDALVYHAFATGRKEAGSRQAEAGEGGGRKGESGAGGGEGSQEGKERRRQGGQKEDPGQEGQGRGQHSEGSGLFVGLLQTLGGVMAHGCDVSPAADGASTEARCLVM